MEHKIEINPSDIREYRNLGGEFTGASPDGRAISANSFFFERDGKPFYVICAEIHFSRTEERLWEDDIIKMKLCGINLVSTYLIWNHHEETEGVFDFTGNKNIRRFVELCKKHDMMVIVRIGAFCHGEVRNGGIPDWIYGKPLEPRSLCEGWLDYSRKLYTQYAKQLDGLFFEQGGPIIASQVDNEYMHSSAVWEQTVGVSEEWIYGGGEGDEYMLRLRDLARECGIKAVFFTCTGWGGAATPEGFMPLWGGYAYRPWLFYSHSGEHPLTDEYIYRNYHDNSVSIEGYEPHYLPESLPYACCEMGGGMFCSYYYRFQLPYRSVDAMANIKTASACNFLGYYMFCGGTNPKTKAGGFLNENQTPKMSYDFQAPIGEYGQTRESYNRLRTWHMFLSGCGERLCRMETRLPEGAASIDPIDLSSLRWAVRSEGDSGFVFLNNFQDHADKPPVRGESVTLCLPDDEITIGDISLAPEENCALPFNMPLGDGLTIRYATAQSYCRMTRGGREWSFFMSPEGMTPRYVFDGETAIGIFPETGGSVTVDTDPRGRSQVVCEPGKVCVFSVASEHDKRMLVTLPRSVADNACLVKRCGMECLLISDGTIIADEQGIRLETTASSCEIRCFPSDALDGGSCTRLDDDGLFGVYLCRAQTVELVPALEKVGFVRYNVALPEGFMTGLKDVLLRVDYIGDIGTAFIDGDMIADNFCNGAPWEIGLAGFADRLAKRPLTINITPIRKDANVNVESAMAARMEENSGTVGELCSVTAQPVYEFRII